MTKENSKDYLESFLLRLLKGVKQKERKATNTSHLGE